MKEQGIKTKLISSPFKTRKNGVFSFLLSSSLPEIFKFSRLCKLGTDDVTRCVCGNQNTKARISPEGMGQCNAYFACTFNHMKYIRWYLI